MKFSHQVKIGESVITIEDSAESIAEVWQKIAFWHSLPQRAPKGATDLRLEFRTPKDKSGSPVEYYSIVCLSERKEFKLGQRRGNAGSLFPKQWEDWKPGKDEDFDEEEAGQQPPTTNNQLPPTKSDNVSPFVAKPLTEDELKFRAQRLVTEGRVTFDAASKTYTVQVNDKISYQVKPGPTCDCERFRSAPESNFRCEHIRAVALFTSGPLKPAQRDELKLLVADLLEAGVPDTEIDAAIAKVCDGLYVVEELSPEQIAKAIRTLQGKLNVLAVTRYSEVA
ncbi:MAG: hypothetical protein JNK38_01035 [Acidobacteria bacterium]|nr:hypothetical protein [Acidobacteriota bacterium]